MRRFATALCLSGAFLFALGNAGSAQQVGSEELLGGHENPPVISDGTGDFTAVLDVDRIPFQLTYDVASEGSDADRAHLEDDAVVAVEQPHELVRLGGFELVGEARQEPVLGVPVVLHFGNTADRQHATPRQRGPC